MTAAVTLYTAEGVPPQRLAYPPPGRKMHSGMVFGREKRADVDVVIREPYISAMQCVLHPPSSDRAGWRLQDRSSNGTWVDGKHLGKNMFFDLKGGGEKITFSVRQYPYLTFELTPAAAEDVAPQRPERPAPPSASKRKRRADDDDVASAAAGLEAEPQNVRALERQLASQRKEFGRAEEELTQLRKILAEKEAQLVSTGQEAADAAAQARRELAERVRPRPGTPSVSALLLPALDLLRTPFAHPPSRPAGGTVGLQGAGCPE